MNVFLKNKARDINCWCGEWVLINEKVILMVILNI